VCGDYHALQTMLTHILVNAIQYSDPDTAIQMTLAALNGEAVIEVRDAGIGIPKDDQKRVFEPFFRGGNIGERSGLGLGLTFAQSVVSAHRGSITLESDVNRGTTVTVRLPLMPNQS
jgi:signal transduction histidine kinase